MKYKLLLSILLGFSVAIQAQDKDLTIGNTYYDLQTWRTLQNRMYNFDDGTKGAVWNMGMDFPNFPDLGIGYNYYDGNSWGPDPWQSITSDWAINPSYTAYLENGEMIASQGENGLILSLRENKGTGNWQESILSGGGFKHPVVVTSGPNNSIIQLLYLKADDTFTPTPAQPYRGFIWYARSSDGGQSWDVNQQLSELGPDNYLGFTIGSYCWAEPKGEVLSFVAGDYLTDLILMKSEDGGNTWQKTVIWEHPYPMFEIFSFESDSFYCNNGGISIALNNDNEANIAFTLNRVHSPIDMDSLWYDPFVGGVVYWNENRPTFSNNFNALNPNTNHPDSELEEDYSLIGWVQDINGNDTLDLVGVITYPTPGLCVMPQIITEDYLDDIFVAFSAAAEGYNNGVANYRHIWIRPSQNGDWWGNFIDLNDNLIYVFSECIYPSFAPNFDDYAYLTFQEDNEPGITIPPGPIYSENHIRYMSVDLGWNPPWISADFYTNTTTIYEGDTIQFENLSSVNPPYPLESDWVFESGTPSYSSDDNPIVVYNDAGTFDVSLTVTDGVMTDVEIKSDYITVLPATNIYETNKNENIEIYPNPGNGMFTINLNLENPDDINVYNILGEKILNYPNEKITNQLKLDLTNQENGIYFIQIKTGSILITKKIAVQH